MVRVQKKITCCLCLKIIHQIYDFARTVFIIILLFLFFKYKDKKTWAFTLF